MAEHKDLEELNPRLMVRSLYFSPLDLVYDDQFSDPSFHSWNRPSNKITRNRIPAISACTVFISVFRIGIGINRTI